jgi:hypothetical protein
MTYPYASTLTDLFLPDGYGAFGYGSGGYGGYSELLNPQWNTNSGNYGIDPYTGLPSIEATSSPSYVGASTYNMEFDTFFAKIVPAPSANGGVVTALLVKADAYNYVEMSVGPAGVFNAYGVNSRNVVLLDVPMPTYDPVAHAFWRIRNDDKILFHFDVSPDGVTWTELGNGVSYLWDASAVTISFFAGFSDLEPPGQLAYVTNINQPGVNLSLKGLAASTAAAAGFPLVSPPNALSARVAGHAGFNANFNVTLGIPQGGLTDFAFTYDLQNVDPMMVNTWNSVNLTASFTGASPFTRAAWVEGSAPWVIPTTYRDGSYWPPARYAVINSSLSFVPDNGPNLMTNVQLEQTPGLSNRLPLNASIYNHFCAYAPGPGVGNMVRTNTIALTGQYSGKITASGNNQTIGTGQYAYWILPGSSAMVSVRQSGGTVENMFGSVYLSTTRVNTNWFASFIFYDANYNILSASTYEQATITNMNVHPGGAVWQPGNVYATAIPTNAVWAAVVPVVIATSPTMSEVTYTSNNSITGASLYLTDTNTPYTSPRTANITVKADRVNYALNSGFNSATTYWGQVNVNTSGSPNPATMSWDGTTGYQSLGSMKVNFVAASGTFTGTSNGQMGTGSSGVFQLGTQPIVQGLKVGHTYTFSAWIKQSANCPDVFMNFYDENFVGMQAISTNAAKATATTVGWTQISGTYTVIT